ncbi:hypothetical protein CC78DRAFT_619071 [Lojkania enalia]|uniref:Uncharacterized protein n=1 Tax=Lojkania enalia TaxID=147567 RepID=A0A9P4N1T5_9PLEO|nr:hypothetical protein CC78DRAFT_619071 [Didymosphaeria enalia]
MYAVLDLAKDVDKYPEPNYSKNIEDVYIDFARSYIKHTGSLEWLNEASCRLYAQTELSKQLPSWVPNWMIPGRNGIIFKNHDGLEDWYYSSRLYNIFSRNLIIDERGLAEISREIELSKADDHRWGSHHTDEEEDFNPAPSHLPIIRPPGIRCDTISKVATTNILSMSYRQIMAFIGNNLDGNHPTGLPLFKVLYRTSLMGIYPVNRGVGSLDPIVESNLTCDLAKGFLLQVMLDYGYLREILPIDSGLVVHGSFGRAGIEAYEFAYPGYDIDFRFLDLNLKSGLAKNIPEFATFRSFRAARAADKPLEKGLYWFLIDHFRQRVRDQVADVKLFITKYGYIGLATNPNIKEGDIFTVLYGGKTPFILRQTESSKYQNGPEHMLMSDAYVYGLMEGEAVKHQDGWMRDDPEEPAFRYFTIV